MDAGVVASLTESICPHFFIYHLSRCPPLFTSCPPPRPPKSPSTPLRLTHPQEAAFLLPRHLWVSPDGRKASGNERKQPILSERIRMAVHHGAHLQGVCERVCATLSTTDQVCARASVHVCVRIKSLTHRECNECVHMFVHQCRVV